MSPTYPVSSGNPKMLWLASLNDLRLLAHILGAADVFVGCRLMCRPQTEKGLKSGSGLAAPVVSENELVQVDLKLFTTDAVMGANQPLLEISDRSVNQRYCGFRSLAKLRPVGLGAGNVMVAFLAQLLKTLESIGVDRGTWRDILFGEVNECCRLEIWNNSHSKTPGSVCSAFLYGNHYESCTATFELSDSTESGLRPADPGVIDLDLSVEGLPGLIDHRSSKLVKHHPGGFVAFDP